MAMRDEDLDHGPGQEPVYDPWLRRQGRRVGAGAPSGALSDEERAMASVLAQMRQVSSLSPAEMQEAVGVHLQSEWLRGTANLIANVAVLLAILSPTLLAPLALIVAVAVAAASHRRSGRGFSWTETSREEILGDLCWLIIATLAKGAGAVAIATAVRWLL